MSPPSSPAASPPASTTDLAGIQAKTDATVNDIMALLGGGAPPAPAPEEAPPAEPPVEAAPAPAPQVEVTMAPADPELLERATSKMVEAGILDKVTGQMTPEIADILVASAEKEYPGLIDFSNPKDLEEVLKGVANGTIPLEPTGKLARAAADAGAASGGVPGLGAPGLPGAGGPGLGAPAGGLPGGFPGA